MKNCFPCDITQRVVNNYLCKFFNHDNLPRDGQTKKGSTLFFELPFIGPFSHATQSKIKVITKIYCKDLDIRLVFTSYKFKNMFVVKDAVPHSLRSLVVYKFSCAGCGACYVGETARHFSTRVQEHLFSDRNSHIYKHLKGFWVLQESLFSGLLLHLRLGPYSFSTQVLKLINYSYCYQPTRTAHSGQVDEFRNPMKNELKTTRV